MIDVEIIKPPENEYLNCLCIDDGAYPIRIETRIIKIRLSSLSVTKSNYFYYQGTLYKIYAYERNMDRSRNKTSN